MKQRFLCTMHQKLSKNVEAKLTLHRPQRPRWDGMYSCNLSLTSVLNRGGLATGLVWTDAENLAPACKSSNQIVQPVASRYTNYTTPAHVHMSKSILSSDCLTFIILYNHTQNSQNFNKYVSWENQFSVHSDPRTFKTTDSTE